MEIEEGAVELIGLADQVLGATQTRVGAEKVHPAADRHGRVEPGAGESEPGE